MGRRKKIKPEDPSKSKSSIRCAVDTRKSTSEGLDSDFNTLDAQREACEAYIASQKHEGWVVLDAGYDDGGFSGGSMERPALERLMAHIEAGEVDCVVVYKVDRLSRSLLDFSRLMQLFEQKQVHFVSVTQHFNTADSMGRLTLNILLSFAQFEREIIGERTRDKIAAQRKKGRWAGGWQVLGYDVDKENKTLVINEDEAEQVRAIFDLYLKHESLVETANQANRRGWTTKRWITAKGKSMGGKPFDKSNMNYLLMNETYIGRVRHKQESYAGLHEAIIDQATWDRVQTLLHRNAKTRGAFSRNRYQALLKGLLRCKSCNAAMIHSACNRDNRQYRYYVCTRAQKRGHSSCETKSVKAESIEQAVINQLSQIPIDQTQLATASIKEAAALFDSESSITNEERARLIRMLIRAVEYDRITSRISIELADEAASCIKATA